MAAIILYIFPSPYKLLLVAVHRNSSGLHSMNTKLQVECEHGVFAQIVPIVEVARSRGGARALFKNVERPRL